MTELSILMQLANPTRTRHEIKIIRLEFKLNELTN
jgi:hypothetical protein